MSDIIEGGQLISAEHGVDYRHEFRVCKTCKEPYPLTDAYFGHTTDYQTGAVYWKRDCKWCFNAHKLVINKKDRKARVARHIAKDPEKARRLDREYHRKGYAKKKIERMWEILGLKP